MHTIFISTCVTACRHAGLRDEFSRVYKLFFAALFDLQVDPEKIGVLARPMHVHVRQCDSVWLHAHTHV